MLSFTGLNTLQTLSTFTRRINLFTQDLKLTSPQIYFNCFRRKTNLNKHFLLNFSSKTKIIIDFVGLFDLKTSQRLLHSSFVPKKQNLTLFLQKFDRYDFMPLQKEVSCSNVKTMFRKVQTSDKFLDYILLQFSLKRNCMVSLYFIKFIPKNKIYRKTSI